MVDFGEIPEPERNVMYLLFTDPRMRSLYPDWKGLARSVVAYIRMEAARRGLHAHRTLWAVLVHQNEKAPLCGTFTEPSSGLEPETPSLPWRCSTN